MTPEQQTAYNELHNLIQEWAEDNCELVPRPVMLADMAADYVFDDLLEVERE